MNDLINGRCAWCGEDELYVKYHDEEWGRKVSDNKTLFEFIVLESAQAGLSWITILRKRDGYRKAFHDFNPEKVSKMTSEDVERLMNFDGIVKHRRKIESTISNAKCFLEIVDEYGSFDQYIKSFLVDGEIIDNHPKSLDDVPTTSPISDAISGDMKKRGFKFFGSVTCYAFLQATGYINDHLESCNVRKQ